MPRRLACECGHGGCTAGDRKPASPVVIHVIADQANLNGTSDSPGSLIGADTLVPPELLAELAKSATLRPLTHPGDAPPEAGYVPSTALAEFVRCRDLTCRFPGCDRPAVGCDLDRPSPTSTAERPKAAKLRCC